MTCPDPLTPAYISWETWRLAGGVKAERPAGLPQRIPQGWWACLQSRRPKPVVTDPYANLGVYRLTCFFVNPTAGSPVGGAKEILAAAENAGVTCAALNQGDGGDWREWLMTYPRPYAVAWARCDTIARIAKLFNGSIANIESPELNSGFCTPAKAHSIVGDRGAIITEATVPHADWTTCKHLPLFIEIDPNVAIVRDKGVRHLVEYGRVVSGNQCVIPAFFITANALWDGSQATFETYWDWCRETWPAPLPFALYGAENVPDWRIIK